MGTRKLTSIWLFIVAICFAVIGACAVNSANMSDIQHVTPVLT